MRYPRRSTKPSNPTPRWLTLRFPAPCATCGKFLPRGETAYYDPPTKRLWGAACGHAQAGADLILAAGQPKQIEPVPATPRPRIVTPQTPALPGMTPLGIDPADEISDFERGLQAESEAERRGWF